jgi:hypothetical protein
VIIEQITIINTFNIADGTVMVPILYETGSLMAYLLYPDPTGMLGELYGFISSFRQLPDNFQRT